MTRKTVTGTICSVADGDWAVADVRVEGAESSFSEARQYRAAFVVRSADGTKTRVEPREQTALKDGREHTREGTWQELRAGEDGVLLMDLQAAPSFPLRLEAQGFRRGDAVEVEGALARRTQADGSEGYREAAPSEEVLVAEHIGAHREPRLGGSSRARLLQAFSAFLLLAEAILVWLAVPPTTPVFHALALSAQALLSGVLLVVAGVCALAAWGYVHVLAKTFEVTFAPFPQFIVYPESEVKASRNMEGGLVWVPWALPMAAVIQTGYTFLRREVDDPGSMQRGIWFTIGATLVLIGMVFSREILDYWRLHRRFRRLTAGLCQDLPGWTRVGGTLRTAVRRTLRYTKEEVVMKEPSKADLTLEVDTGDARVGVDVNGAALAYWTPKEVRDGKEGKWRVHYRAPVGSSVLVAAYGAEADAPLKSTGPETLLVALGPPDADLAELVRKSRRLAWEPYFLIPGVVLAMGLLSYVLRDL